MLPSTLEALGHWCPCWGSLAFAVIVGAAAVATPSAAMRRDIREVLFLIGEAVIIISAIASTIIVAGLAVYTVFP